MGSELVARLEEDGHGVAPLVRREPREGQVRWDPHAPSLDEGGLEAVDWVVHLSGENIAGRRWSAAQKAEIRASRIGSTRFLCEVLAKLEKPPAVVACASAVGYYGDRGDEVLREDSGVGAGFLSEISAAWEEATRPASERGIRVVHLRFGILLSIHGGALAKMLTPFKLGVAGRIGSGGQYMSWISMRDAIRCIVHVLETDALAGPVNVVAPKPVTNAEFTRILGKVLRRPTFFPLPAFVARLALGEMAEALLLASSRVEPVRLLESGFHFQHADLEETLRYLLGK